MSFNRRGMGMLWVLIGCRIVARLFRDCVPSARSTDWDLAVVSELFLTGSSRLLWLSPPVRLACLSLVKSRRNIVVARQRLRRAGAKITIVRLRSSVMRVPRSVHVCLSGGGGDTRIPVLADHNNRIEGDRASCIL